MSTSVRRLSGRVVQLSYVSTHTEVSFVYGSHLPPLFQQVDKKFSQLKLNAKK